MPNILDLYKAYVDGSIEEKTLPFSITKFDVGDGLKNLSDLALLTPVAKVEWTYPKDFLSRDSSYNLYLSLADDVNGDTTNGANWQLVSSASGNKQVYAQSAVGFADAYQVTDPTMTAYATDKIIIATPDVANATTTPTYKVEALADLPIKKFSAGSYVDLAIGDFNGTVFLLYKTTFFLLYQGGGGGESAFKQTITCDGIVDLYTITHGKNNYAPSVSAWFLDTGNSIWQPLDATQGITGSTSDPNVIYFNPMVYMGNNNGFIYKLTIPA